MKNTIINGDCIEIMRRMHWASVDFILTDPPYLVNYRDRTGRSVANDDNDAWLKPAFRQMHRVLRPNSLCVGFAPQKPKETVAPEKVRKVSEAAEFVSREPQQKRGRREQRATGRAGMRNSTSRPIPKSSMRSTALPMRRSGCSAIRWSARSRL